MTSRDPSKPTALTKSSPPRRFLYFPNSRSPRKDQSQVSTISSPSESRSKKPQEISATRPSKPPHRVQLTPWTTLLWRLIRRVLWLDPLPPQRHSWTSPGGTSQPHSGQTELPTGSNKPSMIQGRQTPAL